FVEGHALLFSHHSSETAFAEVCPDQSPSVGFSPAIRTPDIRAQWVVMTPRIAQIALRFGADDIDGTIVEERIYHDAGATTTQGMRRTELLQLIRKAGREPVERDTLCRAVERSETTFTVLV